MTATIIGATGLIGNFLLEEILKDNYYDKVRVLVRRPFSVDHPKLEKKLVNFNDVEGFRLALEGSDVIFCCIGTTQKKVKGNKEDYRKIDFDITVNAAQFSKLSGCETFIFVSSIGATSQSNNFYMRLKGEIEDAVKAIGLNRLYIIQPSILLGNRKEFRLGESISKGIMSAISFLIPTKFKPISGRNVARAMLAASKISTPGVFTFQFPELTKLGK